MGCSDGGVRAEAGRAYRRGDVVHLEPRGWTAFVNDAQMEAGRAVDALMTGETQDIHRTMVALQQADVSFQLMMQVRNKLVAAYEEIQRMQI